MKHKKSRLSPVARFLLVLAAAAAALFVLHFADPGLLQGLLSGGPPAQSAQHDQELSEAPERPDLTVVSDQPTLPEDPSSAPEEAPAGSLEVYFLDVGQGDSTLLRCHQGEQVFNLLIDTGEYQYADGMKNVLHSLGVERLDAFIITHPHTDHMGCAARVVQNFQIGSLLMPLVTDDMVPTTSAYEALLNAVEKKGLTIIDLNQATFLTGESGLPRFPDGLELRVLAPRQNAAWKDLNNWSAVLRFTYGETSFLFPGDAERDCLDIVREDARRHGWELNSTVLKCSHHGSNDGNLQKWLEAVSPQYAVISCGKDNDYGHPHKEPLRRLNDLGAEVYRTDQDGTILAVSDGKTVAFQTGLPSVKSKEW